MEGLAIVLLVIAIVLLFSVAKGSWTNLWTALTTGAKS